MLCTTLLLGEVCDVFASTVARAGMTSLCKVDGAEDGCLPSSAVLINTKSKTSLVLGDVAMFTSEITGAATAVECALVKMELSSPESKFGNTRGVTTASGSIMPSATTTDVKPEDVRR